MVEDNSIFENPEDLFTASDEPISDSDEQVSNTGSSRYNELNETDFEEIREYQIEINNLDYTKLLYKLTEDTGKEEVFQAIRSYLDTIKDNEEKFYSTPYKDRFDTLPKEDRINCYKLERLINQIVLRYKEEGTGFKFVNNEGKILKSLVQEVYDSLDEENLAGIETDVIELIAGYSHKDFKNIETEMEKGKLEQIVNENEKNINKLDTYKKIIAEIGFISPLAATTAHMFNIFDAKDCIAYTVGFDVFLFGLYNWLSVKKYNISNGIKSLKKELNKKKKFLEEIKDEREINRVKSYIGV